MDKPILFKGRLVRAILAGNKTQTRRLLNPEKLRVRLPYEVRSDMPVEIGRPRSATPGAYRAEMNPHGAVALVRPHDKLLGVKPGEFDFICPYAEGTTRLVNGEWRIEPNGEQRFWVRETWRAVERDHEGRHAVDGVLYAADGIFRPIQNTAEAADAWVVANDNGIHGERWRPSIFMPRWASRITLDVIEVRVQRLQSITEEDAEAEGVSFDGRWWLGAEHPVKGSPKVFSTARDAFASLWDSINLDRGSWASNPWVFAVTFKRAEQLAAGRERAHG